MTGRAGNQQPPAYQQQYTSPPLTMQQIQQLQQLQAQQQHTLRMRASGGQQIRPGGPQRGNFLSKNTPQSCLFRVEAIDHACICSWTLQLALCPSVHANKLKKDMENNKAVLCMEAGEPQPPSMAGFPMAPMPADMQQELQQAQRAQPCENVQLPDMGQAIARLAAQPGQKPHPRSTVSTTAGTPQP